MLINRTCKRSLQGERFFFMDLFRIFITSRMPQRKRIALFVTFITILFIVSCAREKKYLITDNAVREAVNFREGSYFIYRDSMTGIEDSLWVNNYSEGFKPTNTNNYSSLQEIISYELFLKDSIVGQLRAFALDESKNIDSKITGWVFYLFNGSMAISPFSKNIITQNRVSLNTSKDYFERYTIAGKVYSNVNKFETKQLHCLHCVDTFRIETYYSLNSGLVKIRYIDDTVLAVKELIRYKKITE